MRNSSSLLKWSIWALAAIFYFYEFLLRVSPSVMIPELMTSFDITASSVGLLSAFYLYAYAPMQLPVGLLMDRFGVKRVLSIACILCGGGALVFSAAESFTVASIGRLLIGGSSAFAFIAMVYVTSHWFPLKKRAFLIGVANSVAMLGASAGTGPLTVVIRDYGWKLSIGVFGAFGVLLGIAVYLILRGDRHNVEVEQETFHVKMHVLEKLKQVISKRSTWINAIVALFFYMTTTAFAGLWGLSFVQTAYGVSKEIAGFAMSMVFAGWLVGGPLTGLFSDFLGQRKTAIRIGIVGTLLCLVPVIYFPTIPIYVAYMLLFFVGFFSSAELLNFILAIELSSIRAKATAAAFTNCMISIGDALVQPFVGFLLDFNWDGTMQNGIRMYKTGDYQVALSCLPIVLILAYFLLFFIKEEKHEAS
ncbi:MAG: MFS transporter [Chlamydiota bacterium]